jgi:hypothetical protein
MSFCISYNERCVQSPFEDWLQSGEPETAAIRSKYDRGHHGYITDYVFVPSMNLLRIEVSSLTCGFRATAKVKVDPNTLTVHITEAHCVAWKSDTAQMAPEGSGSIELLSSLIHYYDPDSYSDPESYSDYGHTNYDDDHMRDNNDNDNDTGKHGIYDTISRDIFGSGWQMSKLPPKDEELPCFQVERLNEWVRRNMPDRNYTARYAYYDMTREISAIKIQAAFRGWRARMQYRYNPYSNLGRFVLLREAGFDPLVS